MSTVAPSASYSLTVRLAIQNRTGVLGRSAMAIGNASGDIGAVDLVESGRDRIIRDITINARDSVHGMQIVNRLKQLAGVRVVNISDRTFLMHLGGKIEVQSKVPVRTRDDLSMAYTPGVARVSLAIKEDRQRAFSLTIKQNTVAVVTDGTAVLGLGDIGPEAALPNALRIVKKDLKKLRVVVTGVGAAGTATIKILLSSGVRDIIGVDEHGTIYRGRAQGMDFMKRWVAGATNPRQVKGRLADALARAELSEEYIIPSVFNKAVAPAVAAGVARAAHATGVARRRRQVDLSVIPS